MIRRLSVDDSKAVALYPLADEGDGGGAAQQVTVRNLSKTATIEVVDDEATGFGEGFPVAPEAAWDTIIKSERLWLITDSGSAVSVAVSATATGG